MALQERGDDLVDAPGGGPTEDAEGDGPSAQRREFADAARRILDSAEAADGVLREGPPRIRGNDAAARADEQVRAERLLELADLLRHRRLGDAEGRGRGGE